MVEKKRIYTVAVVEDEEDISELISLHLRKNFFQPKVFLRAGDFISYLDTCRSASEKNCRENDSSLANKEKDLLGEVLPDLILLDLMLPDMDGMDICKYLKAKELWRDIPIIILTAKQDETDMILGLEFGADDYITKPFSPRALIARIKAVMRRSSSFEGKEKEENIIDIAGEIFIALDRYTVTDAALHEISLTTTEFKLLTILASKPGWVFSREKLIAQLWGEDRCVIDRTIDVHIKHLREKLGSSGRLIRNIRGVGYKLEQKEG